MDQTFSTYAAFLVVVRYALFVLAVVVALVALVDWAVRTRKLNPFGPIARFCRRFVDPLMLPVERRIVRAGGQPTNAPWWTLVAVVVGGLVLIWALEFFGGMLARLYVGFRTPGGLVRLFFAWTFGLLRLALAVRVISSWFGLSPYSKWVRWSYTLTEWMIAPLRRVIPPLGPIDISPLVAFFLLSIAQNVIGG